MEDIETKLDEVAAEEEATIVEPTPDIPSEIVGE